MRKILNFSNKIMQIFRQKPQVLKSRRKMVQKEFLKNLIPLTIYRKSSLNDPGVWHLFLNRLILNRK